MNKFDANCQSLVDTIHFVIDSPYPSLNWRESRDNDYGASFQRGMKNMNVIYNNGKLKVQGSISKFYFGNNLRYLTLNEFKEAVEMLSEDLQCDVSEALIKRIDLAGNLYLQHEVESYFSCLSVYKRFKRINNGNSLYFSTNGKQSQAKALFYNKVDELGRTEAIRLSVYGLHIMRYELRLKTPEIRNKLSSNLTLKDLYDHAINDTFIHYWMNQYNEITKSSPSQFQLKEKFGDRDLRNVLAKQGMDHLGGYAECIQLLQKSPHYQELRPEERTRRKNVLNKINNVGESIITGNLLDELDHVINNFVL